jgi:uncharacterized secreted protein with C-terminal beta-propeller domain
MTTARYAAASAVLLLLAGCTTAAPPKAVASAVPVPAPVRETGALKLAAASSCAELMADLRAAAGPRLGAVPGIADDARGGAAAAPKADDTGPSYSTTNTAEPDADEPDLVKTDGRRIVTVTDRELRVVDAASRAVTGTLSLAGNRQPSGLLLAGDRALVLFPTSEVEGLFGAQVLLVDLSGPTPTIASGYVMDGALVDARQVGTVARVVIRSWPRFRSPTPAGPPPQEGPDDWLPRYAVTTGGRTTTGRVDCARVRLPERYSGTSMLSVLTFDLGRPALSDGDPVTIVADGETVYANGTGLYVAAGGQWFGQTDIYKFDISGAGRPVYVAAGTVPGRVLNQYALSEWDGYLRVATTLNEASSSVTVLADDHGLLHPVGSVEGLGKGQRIYAVRFAGPVGYVVTFRQTDPLYTLDLHDPANPAVTGQLELTGYSAYLHPVGAGRLIGVGQASTEQGRNLGVQVSLFDVADPGRPARLARYDLPGSGHSLAEFDPHAFLFWPATGLLVIPLRTGALALRVTDTGLAKAGDLHPAGGMLLRSLVVGTTLWTLTPGGLAAADLPV